ncbi:hypothetical protein ABBQ38_012634 [Trebouxia sp. C0009 RCD-2024]
MLPQLLSPDAQRALSAANRSFQEYFVSQIRVVTAPCEDDTSWVNTRTWPLLSMIILQGLSFCKALSDRDLAQVYVAGTTMRKFNHAVIHMIRPLRTAASESGWVTCAAQQLVYQITAKFPNPGSFEFMGSAGVTVDGRALSMAVVVQISKGNWWSSLTSLSFQDCKIGCRGLSLLIQGDWPVLESLDVSGNRIDAGGMALLAKGNWPLLTQLVLSSNPSIGAVAIAHLSAARWPLEGLKLDHMPVTAARAAELAKLRLPNLNSISLCGARLTAAAMSGLVEASWPRLSCFSLRYDNLDAVMQHLCKMQLPALESLDLAHASLTEEGAHCLASGQWPFLTKLELSCNNLSAKAVEHIASGVWPRLQCLSLYGNPIGHVGAQHLTKGDWPLLGRLSIGYCMLEMHDSPVCLGLDLDKVQGLKFDTSDPIIYLERNVSQASVSLWPNLCEIVVVNL